MITEPDTEPVQSSNCGLRYANTSDQAPTGEPMLAVTSQPGAEGKGLAAVAGLHIVGS